MSKSLGNGLDPLELIDEVGADALRYSLVNGIAISGDMCFSKEGLINYRNFMNKLFNASKFVLNYVSSGYDNKAKPVTPADKWLAVRLNEVISIVTKAFDKYDVGRAASTIYDFIWNEFCDKYLELAKVQLKDEKLKNNTAGLLLKYLEILLKLAHPIIPFITTEIYDSLPEERGELMLSAWPKKISVKAENEVKNVELLNDIIRATRNLMHTNPAVGKSPKVFVMGSPELKSLVATYLPFLAKTDSVESIETPPENAALLAFDGISLYLPLADASAETDRLKKELQKAESELKLASGKLNNKGFTDKAPEKLVNAEKEKVEKYTRVIEIIKEKLKELGA